MECPKCHSIIDDDCTVCPKCKKVLLLECPNCHELGDSSVCSTCGNTILIKCAKCGKINPTTSEFCNNCGFSVKSSVAFQECESDEFASVVIKFNNLRKLIYLMNSDELYYKLKNILKVLIKNIDCKVIFYDDITCVNFNKELSLSTSSDKAVKFSIELANAIYPINKSMIENHKIPLDLEITISQKPAEKLLELIDYKNTINPLVSSGKHKTKVQGIRIILDEFIRDEINKKYKTDSWASIEKNGKMTAFYTLIPDSYINNSGIVNIAEEKNSVTENYGNKEIKVFDINAKCKFIKTNAVELREKLSTIISKPSEKIIAFRSEPEHGADLSEIIYTCTEKGMNVISVNCTGDLKLRAWGVLDLIFKKYCKYETNLSKKFKEIFKPLFDLGNEIPVNSHTPEDARFTYMELWYKFLSILKNTVIIINGFENLDNTTLQTFELYFENLKNIVPKFIFITKETLPVHSKFKNLLRTPYYSEYSLESIPFESCLNTIKTDAEEFINSPYFEQIKSGFNGSYKYFRQVLDYLKTKGAISEENDSLIVKNYELSIPITIEDVKKINPDTEIKYSDMTSKAIKYFDSGDYKNAYKTLVKNSDYTLLTGDYDAYLENTKEALNLAQIMSKNLFEETLTEYKNGVYTNVLNFLYDYAPEKVYEIEKHLLKQEELSGNDKKITKLSNLMLQGALKLSKYNDTPELLCNIVSRLENPALVVDGAINTKFLLLSLVQIDVFYHTGDYRQCVGTADELLSVLHPKILDKIKPQSFSLPLFIKHLSDTLLYAALSKLYLADDDLEKFFGKVKRALGIKHPEEDCILAIRDYLAGKIYLIGNVKDYSAYSKLVFLLLQEISILKSGYKRFAQNIFQAKLLAEDINQIEIKYLCDLLIGFAYLKIGNFSKAHKIFTDVLKIADESSIFSLSLLSRYFMTMLNLDTDETEKAMVNINSAFALMREKDNQPTVLYVMFEKLYIDIAKAQGVTSIDIDSEEQKLAPFTKKLKRIIS